jgi:hypothetical protein
VETETYAETLEFTLALQQEAMRIEERDFGKADMIASAKLSCDAQIDGDHVRYFWITTNRLAISLK